jgi:hypothetical protein
MCTRSCTPVHQALPTIYTRVFSDARESGWDKALPLQLYSRQRIDFGDTLLGVHGLVLWPSRRVGDHKYLTECTLFFVLGCALCFVLFGFLFLPVFVFFLDLYARRG